MKSSIKITFLLFLLFLAGCNLWKKIPEQPEDIDKKKVQTLLKKAEDANLKYEYLNAKISGKYDSQNRNLRFRANIRILKDSVVWISVTPGMGIEFARFMITKDSVKIINRLQNTFVLGEYEAIKELAGANIPFETLQNFISGNVPAFDAVYHWKADTVKNQQYIYERKTEYSDEEYKKPFSQEFWLDPSNYKLQKVKFEQLKQKYRVVSFKYSDFEIAEGKIYPGKIKGKIQGSSNTEIMMKMKNVEFDGPLEFPFNVSSKYTKKEF